MDIIVTTIKDAYNQLLQSGDSRVQSWPLVNTPFPTMAICLSYAFFVNKIGPKLMESRSPLNIRWLMVSYNLIMVVLSSYLFYGLGIYGWFPGRSNSYDYRCQPVDFSNSKDAIGMATFAWYYYITKFIEFADTMFFIMRKKFDHVSTLHIVHHGIMPMRLVCSACNMSIMSNHCHFPPSIHPSMSNLANPLQCLVGNEICSWRTFFLLWIH